MGGRSVLLAAGMAALFAINVPADEPTTESVEQQFRNRMIFGAIGSPPRQEYRDWNKSLVPDAENFWQFRNVQSEPSLNFIWSTAAEPLPALLGRFWSLQEAVIMQPSFLDATVYDRHPDLIDPVTRQAMNAALSVTDLPFLLGHEPEGVPGPRLNDPSASIVPKGESFAAAEKSGQPALDSDQRSPSRIFLTDDIQHFPAAPERKIVQATKEAPAAPSKPLPAPLLPTVSPPASTTIPSTAAPTVPAAITPPAAPLSKQRRQRRAKWSEALQAPAALTIDPEEKLTLGDLLERIRKQHGLPVRVDLPHVLPITAMTEMVATRLSPKRSNATVQSPLLPSAVPFGVYNTYSSDPVLPSGLPVPYAPANSEATLPPVIPPYAPSNLPIPAAAPIAPVPVYKAVLPEGNDQPVSAIQAEVIPEKPAPIVKEEAAPENSNDSESGKNEAVQAIQTMLAEMLKAPVDTATIIQPEATVEDVLRQAFDRSFPLQALINAGISEEFPMLTSLSRATEWDLLIQDDGVLLTTRLNANLHKETRVYSVKALEKSAGLKAEDVARVLTRTVRPWSWKKNFSEAITAEKTTTTSDKTKSGTKTSKKYTVPKVNLDLSSLTGLISSAKTTADHHLRLVNNDGSTPPSAPESSSENVELTEEDLELLGRMWDGLFQGAVSSIQVIYHADPPTGVIEVLPGMLVISQSQSAHREISDLLEQLSDPAN